MTRQEQDRLEKVQEELIALIDEYERWNRSPKEREVNTLHGLEIMEAVSKHYEILNSLSAEDKKILESGLYPDVQGTLFDARSVLRDQGLLRDLGALRTYELRALQQKENKYLLDFLLQIKPELANDGGLSEDYDMVDMIKEDVVPLIDQAWSLSFKLEDPSSIGIYEAIKYTNELNDVIDELNQIIKLQGDESKQMAFLDAIKTETFGYMHDMMGEWKYNMKSILNSLDTLCKEDPSDVEVKNLYKKDVDIFHELILKYPHLVETMYLFSNENDFKYDKEINDDPIVNNVRHINAFRDGEIKLNEIDDSVFINDGTYGLLCKYAGKKLDSFAKEKYTQVKNDADLKKLQSLISEKREAIMADLEARRKEILAQIKAKEDEKRRAEEEAQKQAEEQQRKADEERLSSAIQDIDDFDM